MQLQVSAQIEHLSQGFMLRTPSITASKRCSKNPMHLDTGRHQIICFAACLVPGRKSDAGPPMPEGHLWQNTWRLPLQPVPRPTPR